MRFLCVSLGLHPDVVGGAWRVAAEQAAGLARRGHSLEIITANPDGRRPAQEIREGITLNRFAAAPGSFYQKWRAQNRAAAALVRERLAAAGADPVLVVQHHAFLEPALATVPAPILHVFHGPWAEEFRFARRAVPRSLPRRALDALAARLMHRVEARALRRAQRILVLSQHFHRQLHRWHPTRLPEVQIAPGGVDSQRFQPLPDRDALRTRWGLTPRDKLFLALRRLDPRMGLDLLIDAFARLAPRHPHAQLWLTGTGAAEASLRSRIAATPFAARIRLLGFIPDDDLPSLLNAADATIMPSLDLEGFGLATVEALACGTPVLGSRAGATPEILEPLDPALLFATGSVDALEQVGQNFLTTPERFPSRERCASYARERYSWTALVDAGESAHTRFLSGKAAR